jgi:outer membrane protein assembly factor BamB
MTVRRRILSLSILLLLGAAAAVLAAAPSGDDWPDWRGPDRNGVAGDVGPMPESWSLEGENLLWTAPYGGRSAPVVRGNRVYVQNAVETGPAMQERVMALDIDSGEVIWEHRHNITLSDAPPHRIAWASPVIDRETGNVYSVGIDMMVYGLNTGGELIWDASMSELFGFISTHGGRTASPVIVDDLVIVSGVAGGWGSLARGQHRLVALDKRSGQVAWVASTGAAPYDTTYAPPLVADIGGQRALLIAGGDGAAHAFNARTGEHIWRFAMSKRGLNTGILADGDTVYLSHGEENIADSTMGMVAAIDGSGSGELGEESVKWANRGQLMGYSSPVLDGDTYYQIDNGANLIALDAATGEQLWLQNLGTIQRASPVLADGKLYVGTVNGDLYILRPSRDGVEVLDRDAMPEAEIPEEIIASAAVAPGRVFVVTSKRIVAIGSDDAPAVEPDAGPLPPMPSEGPVAYVRIFPQEFVVAPGDAVEFEARLFDAAGVPVRTVTEAAWSLEGLSGSIDEAGHYVAGDGPRGGNVKVVVDGVEASARLRVIPELPWNYDFDGLERVPPYWIAALGKFAPGDDEGDGVLIKINDNPFLKRTKVYLGDPKAHDYTVQIDFKTAIERRRMGDAGVIAQRFAMIAFGTHQRLEIQSWQPETERTVIVPFEIRPDTWYTIKLETTNLEDGGVRARGKMWLRGDPEPDEWTIEKIDPIGTRKGSPGFYADAHAVVTFDNLNVRANQ